jgi:hypothetical protein
VNLFANLSLAITARSYNSVSKMEVRKLTTFVFALQIYHAAAGHHFIGPLSFGLGGCKYLIEGCELIIGVKLEESGMKKQMDELQKMSGQQLVEGIDGANSFGIVAAQGDFVVLPSGYLRIQYRPQETTALRWSVTLGGKIEVPAIFGATAQLCDTFPSLGSSQYAQWLHIMEQMSAPQGSP